MAAPHLKHIRLSHRLENKNTLRIDLYLGSIPAQMLRPDAQESVGMIPTSIRNLLTHLV